MKTAPLPIRQKHKGNNLQRPNARREYARYLDRAWLRKQGALPDGDGVTTGRASFSPTIKP